MRDYFVPYPAFTSFPFNLDPKLQIPNTSFNLIPLGDDAENLNIKQINIKPMNDNFKLQIYETETKDIWELWLSMRADYNNYFTYLVKNKLLNEATFITETTHRPEYNVSINEDTGLINLEIYDFQDTTKYLKQQCLIDFSNMNIVYMKPIIRSY